MIITRDSDKTDNKIFIYYAALTLLTIIMMRPGTEYSSIIRFGYFALVFAPLFVAKSFTPFVITSFYWISFCSFTGLLPLNILFTLAGLLVVWLFARASFSVPIIIAVALFFLFVLSLLFFDFEETGVVWLGIIMVLMLSSFIHTESDLKKLGLAFVLVSFVMSVVFLLHRGDFMESYIRGVDTLERAGWMNPNVIGGTIGCGVVVAMGFLLDGIEKKWPFKLFLFFTVGVSLIVLILNASRGALLATTVASLLFVIINRKVSLFYKVLIVVLLGLFIYYLYTNDYFELLAYRIAEEAKSGGTGGSRIPIWESKLAAIRSTDVFSQLFGVGQTETINIGIRHRTHNDFVTALVAYGFVGFVLFVLTLLYPIYHRFSIKKTTSLLPYFAFLFLECMVLEPLFRGYFLFLVFFLYMFKYSEIYDKSSLIRP